MTDRRAHTRWMKERRGAVLQLAALAKWHAALLRRATIESAESADPAASALLTDAARERH
jgi:hypothetical protein